MTAMPKIAVPQPTWKTESSYPGGLGAGCVPFAQQVLGDAAGLTQFGVYIETLAPGSASSLRHWHEREDEFVYVLSGTVMLVEDDGEVPLGPGDAAGWAANSGVGHCLVNRSDAPASYLVVGTRAVHEVVHYPEHDLRYSRDETGRGYTRRDGSALP